MMVEGGHLDQLLHQQFQSDTHYQVFAPGLRFGFERSGVNFSRSAFSAQR